MTDLHCHILPGIDDGARDVETSIALLSMEKEQGVDRIVFTPHFRCDDIGLDEFLEAFFCAFRISIADFRRRIIPDIYLFPLLLIS